METSPIVLTKEEFCDKFLIDQAKRKGKQRRDNKIVKTGMPFKEEIYIDVSQIIKKLFPEAVLNKEKELKVSFLNNVYHVKVVEKRSKVVAEEKAVKKEPFKGDVYLALIDYYKSTQQKEPFFSNEGVVISHNNDYTVKITKKK